MEHANITADHVTLSYRPSYSGAHALTLGSHVPLRLTGSMSDERTQVPLPVCLTMPFSTMYLSATS